MIPVSDEFSAPYQIYIGNHTHSQLIKIRLIIPCLKIDMKTCASFEIIVVYTVDRAALNSTSLERGMLSIIEFVTPATKTGEENLEWSVKKYFWLPVMSTGRVGIIFIIFGNSRNAGMCFSTSCSVSRTSMIFI